ncbi:MAG: MFS transporter [Bacteriovoracaceae bacterium]|nr:MFS transporter [Bacteriovoracaceae bacterium]
MTINSGFESAKKTKMYLFLLILSLSSVMGFQAWRSLFNNFAVENAMIDGFQMGAIQSVREIPGFLALLVIYVLLIIKEHKLAALSILFLGVGIALTGQLPSFHGIILTTIILSLGFHYFETVKQSLCLQYFDVKTAPLVMTRLKSLGSLASVVTGGIVLIMLKFASYQMIYLSAGFMVVLCGLWAFSMNPTHTDIPVQHKKMIFKKKYFLYYWLTLLAGARRQVFVAFAIFLMVEKFNFSAFEISLLFIINNIINYFVNPYIGKAINRFGERKVLSLEYFGKRCTPVTLGATFLLIYSFLSGQELTF